MLIFIHILYNIIFIKKMSKLYFYLTAAIFAFSLLVPRYAQAAVVRDPNLIYIKISGYNSNFVRSHLPLYGNFTTQSRYAGKVLTIKIKTERDSTNNFGFIYNNYNSNNRYSFNPFRRISTNFRITKYIAYIDYILEDKITGQILASGSSTGESTSTSPRFTTGFGSFSHQSTASSTKEDAVMDALNNLHLNLNSVNYSSYQPYNYNCQPNCYQNCPYNYCI